MATARQLEPRAAVPAPEPAPTPPTRREPLAVLALFLLTIAVRLPTLDQPLVEHHAFRQTQTAYTAVLFHEDGVDLLHPKLPLLGAPFEVPFEFPLFQAAAAAVMSWGVSPDVAMRVTGLAFFLLSALLLWGLVRHVGGRVAALATLALYLFSPFALQWSRAALIEYMAVAGAVGWLWAGLLWRERRRLLYAAAAVAAGTIAMLVKPTTAAFWILPLLAVAGPGEGRGWRAWLAARRDLALAVIVAVPFVVAVLWTRHADAVKAASTATAWLTSDQLATWTFGTIDQRLAAANWSVIGDRVTTQLTGFPAWLLPLLALVGLRTRTARLWAGLSATAFLTVITFWNLYVVHDYYLAAISPIPAALAGYGVARLWSAARQPARKRLLAAALATWIVTVMALNPALTALPYRTVDPGAADVAQLTLPSDLVVFEGYEWEPVLPYYARRAGFMLRASTGPDVTAASLAAAGYRVLVTALLTSPVAADTVRAGRWTGVLGRRVYITGETWDDLRHAPVAATDDPLAVGEATGREPVTLTCGADPLTVARPPGPTVIRLDPATDRRAKLSVTPGLGAVPVRDSIVVAPDLPLVLSCRDAASVTLTSIGPAISQRGE